MAAILSVAIDRRIVEGGTIRLFGAQFGDRLGVPRDPGLCPHMHLSERSVLPYYSQGEKYNIEDAKAFVKMYLDLDAHDAATFLRASCLYQKALLQCDQEPDLAWVWCVSAIETLAEDPGRVDKVSIKFLEFLRQHLPEPPRVRPPYLQVDWNNLEASFAQVYAYRSQFLHAGLPFPAPMNHRPEDVSGGNRMYAELPHGGVGFGSTSFEAGASPMHLHVFMYIVRGAMIKWMNRTYEATRAALDSGGLGGANGGSQGSER